MDTEKKENTKNESECFLMILAGSNGNNGG